LSVRDHLKDLDIDGRIRLIWIMEKKCGREWSGFIWLQRGTGSEFVNMVMNL
jgi:hypothetical protein